MITIKYPTWSGEERTIQADLFFVARNKELDARFSWWSTQPLSVTPSGGASQSDPYHLDTLQTQLVHDINSDPAERWLIHDVNGWLYYTLPKEDAALYKKIVRKPNGQIDPERSKMYPKSYLRASRLDWPHVALGSDAFTGGKNNFLLALDYGSVYQVFGIPADCDLTRISPETHPFWFHRAWVWYGNHEKGRFGLPACGDAWTPIFGEAWFIARAAMIPAQESDMGIDPPMEQYVYVPPLTVLRSGPRDNAPKNKTVWRGYNALLIAVSGEWKRVADGWFKQ